MMKNICKLILSIIAMLVISSAIPVEAKAEETYGDWKYEVLDDGTIMLTSYQGTNNTVEIPAKIDDKKVTSLGEMFLSEWYPDGDRDIRKVIIPVSINDINESAFKWAQVDKLDVDDENKYYSVKNNMLFENKTKSLILCLEKTKKINIPDGTKRISKFAFWDSDTITSIYIPKSVIKIENRAFETLFYLEKITVASKNTKYKSIDGILFNKKGTKLIYYPKNLSQPYEAYYVPEGVKTIGKCAFDSTQYGIKYVYLPEGLRNIEEEAFTTAQYIEYIYVPKSVKNIRENAFDQFNENLTILCEKSSPAWNYVEINKPMWDIGFTCEEPIFLKDAKIKLQKKQYTFNGKEKKPKVKITINGKEIAGYPCYIVKYKNNKDIGKATVNIQGLGKYVGNITKTFEITPRKVTSLKQVSNKSDSTIKMTWKKSPKVTGYEIYRSTKVNGTYKKIKSLKNNSYTNKKLKSDTEYYYKVRAYKTVKGKKIYSRFSKTVVMKTK